jgi:hypothetical protein
METQEAITLFREFYADYEKGKARPRHANTEELFDALIVLALEYVKANKDERDE